MTKYIFGVMSKKWELEANNCTQAYIAMAMFIGKNIPVAVYEPQKGAFMPKDVLKDNQINFKPKLVGKILDSIKEII